MVHILNETFDVVKVINMQGTDQGAIRRGMFKAIADISGLEYEISSGVQLEDGRTGCKEAHLAAARDSRRAFIFEDDATFDPHKFNEQTRMLLKTIPSDWEILLLGCGLERGTREQVSSDWWRIGTGLWGWRAYGFKTMEAQNKFCEMLKEVPDSVHWDTYCRREGMSDRFIKYRPVKCPVRDGDPRRLTSSTRV
jgi:hypothetical protein